jgi:hypothetical protein
MALALPPQGLSSARRRNRSLAPPAWQFAFCSLRRDGHDAASAATAGVLTLDGLPIDEIVLAGPRMHHLSASVASKQSGNSHRNPFLRHLVNCRAFRALEYDCYPHDNADLARQNNRRDVIAFAGIECCISWLLRPVRWRSSAPSFAPVRRQFACHRPPGTPQAKRAGCVRALRCAHGMHCATLRNCGRCSVTLPLPIERV